MSLHPVIFQSSGDRDPAPSASKAYLSHVARLAARASALRSGFSQIAFPKDSSGRPLPDGDLHWSVSHKTACVAGVVSSELIGIDVERIQARRPELFARIAGEEEWGMFRSRNGLTSVYQNWEIFSRLWSAKEAVVKAVLVGLPGLRETRLSRLRFDGSLLLSWRGEIFTVQQLIVGEHVISLATPGTARPEVCWDILEFPAVSMDSETYRLGDSLHTTA